jgi:hypothetical protein
MIRDHPFMQIQRFVAAVRRQWPGAKICLRPSEDSVLLGADTPKHPEPAPGDKADG